VPFIDADTGEWTRYWFWTEEEVTGFASLSLSHEHAFEAPGHSLTSSVEYILGWEDESYFLNEESAVRVGRDATFLDAREHTLPVAVDYVRPVAAGRIEAGGRYQKRWIPVDYDLDQGEQSVLYPGLGDETEWQEDIIAAYANLVFERQSYTLEAGMRLEQVDVRYDIDENNIYYNEGDSYDYFELYPNARLAWRFDPNRSVALAYSRRVDRPGEPELRIFPKVDDPELMKVGNPYLRPQFTDSAELAFEQLWESGSAIASLYLRDIEDSFRRVYSIDDSNFAYDIVNRVFQNTGFERNTGFELLLSQDVGDALRLTGSINLYRVEIDRFTGEVLFPTPRPFTIAAADDNTWDSKLNAIFALPFDIEAQVTAVYYADRAIAQGRRGSRSSLDIALRRPLGRQGGEVTLSVTDLLNDFGIEETINADGLKAEYANFYETQVIRLGVKFEL
jgi:outer membrane receptor protein involved in Fe transport